MHHVRPPCYTGDDTFATFEECWSETPAAHVFPDEDQERMKAGAYKCCFMGVLCVAMDALPQMKHDIHQHNPNLTTHDIVTCMDFGIFHHACVSEFRVGASVFVVNDLLRPSLNGKGGVVKRHSEDGVLVVMDMVYAKDIGQVTRGSVVEVRQRNDVLDGRQGIALDDGDMRGLCRVKIDSIVYTIPCIWLASVVTEPPHSTVWGRQAIVSVMPEQIVPARRGGESGGGASSVCADIGSMVAKFDEKSEVTAKVFCTAEASMEAWQQPGQKNAVVDCMCERHRRCTSEYLHGETICYGDTVHFTWDGCTGTQSVFECGRANELFYYVDNSTAAIRAEARIGRFSRETGSIEWEFAPAHRLSATPRIVQRDEGLLVVGSSVTHRHDGTRTGTLQRMLGACRRQPAKKTCLVEWKTQPAVVTEEETANLERSFLIQQVLLPASLVVGKIAQTPPDCASNFVLVDFKGHSEIGDRIGEAWFDLKQLDDSRLRHRLHSFMLCAWRVVRFTVQERTGISISSLTRSKLTANDGALYNFFAAVSTFCHGASRMHANNITHGDLNDGNITIAQTSDKQHFSLKMIDLDEMKEHPPGKVDIREYQNDLTCIMQTLLKLTQHVQCDDGDDRIQLHNFTNMLHAKSREARHMPVCSPSAETAGFLSTLAEICG